MAGLNGMAMELKQDCGVVLLKESLTWHIAHCSSRNFLSAIVVSTRSNSIVSQQSTNKYQMCDLEQKTRNRH